jgi:hypothetical protein
LLLLAVRGAAGAGGAAAAADAPAPGALLKEVALASAAAVAADAAATAAAALAVRGERRCDAVPPSWPTSEALLLLAERCLLLRSLSSSCDAAVVLVAVPLAPAAAAAAALVLGTLMFRGASLLLRLLRSALIGHDCDACSTDLVRRTWSCCAASAPSSPARPML